MGGIFQGITNAFGGLLGETDAQYAQKQSQNSANLQSMLQQKYGGQAANVYAGLLGQGQQQSSVYQNNYLNLLNQYAGLSGVGSNPINTRPTAGGSAGPGGVPGQGNLAQTLNSQPGQGQPQAGPDPYLLDPNQQRLLNQSNAQIAQAAKSAEAQFVQHMSAQGINDPRALQVGQEQLQEHFSALQQETEAKFYESVKQDKLAALQQILSGLQQYGSQGVQEQEVAGTGYQGLATSAQQAAITQQQNALNASQANDSSLSGLLNLVGFATGGGFGGAGGARTPPIVSPTSNLTGLLG